MKKFSYVSLAGAIVLASAVALTGCKNKAEDEVRNPSEGAYTGETVKTQFVINIAEDAAGVSRRNMSSETVQAAATKASFRGMDGISIIPFAETAAAAGNTPLEAKINLPSTTIAAGESDLKSESNAYVYDNISIPLGTQSLLFYASAINQTNVAWNTDKTNHVNGKINVTGLSTGAPAGITFDLAQIETTDADIADDAVAQELIAYLNSIAGVTGWSTTTDAVLRQLYIDFMSLKAGSSLSIMAAVEDLNTTLTGLKYSVALAADIQAAIVATAHGVTEDTDGKLVVPSTLAGFPASQNLPDGAVTITGDAATATFAYNTTATTVDGAITTDYKKFVYPASLYYVSNSEIVTAGEPKKEMYDTVTNWNWFLTHQYLDGGVVKTTTRSVAIKDKIQYAVARLDVRVKRNADLLAYTDVNGKEQTLAVTDASFPVTAIFVGGQQTALFDFTPENAEVGDLTIYDNEVPASWTVLNKPYTDDAMKTNHTLVLETPADKNIKIAIELTNASGKDFYGLNKQLIPAGTKFYLAGEMKLTTGQDKVFKQDYITTAQLNIKDLKKAYNVIPDLTTESLELGFSVDLNWQTGYTFDVDL